MGSSVDLFSRYRKYSDILIETGTYVGDGVERAFVSGYRKVYSCDVNPEYVSNAKEKFKDKDFIVELNPSEIALKKFLSEIDQRCVIFLDGHAMPYDINDPNRGFGSDTLSENALTSPLVEELKIIKEHHIKDHIILIDDFHCFNTWCFGGLEYDDVLEFVKTINPKYKSIIDKSDYNVLCFFV
jgi:hypothetical protein